LNEPTRQRRPRGLGPSAEHGSRARRPTEP
jgi:hypothetical protein